MHPNLLDLPRKAVTACDAMQWSPDGCKVIRMTSRQIITRATDHRNWTLAVVSLLPTAPWLN